MIVKSGRPRKVVARMARNGLSVIAALLLTSCDDRPEAWTGWAYPNRENLTYSVSLTGFRTFEQCQEATIGALRTFSDPDAGDYECGFKCRWDPNFQTNVCKTTRK